MKLYHMSDSLQAGMELVSDFKRNAGLAEPFVKALRFNRDVFFAMMLNAYYFGEVLAKYKMTGMPTNETKWACEGVFEFIRRTEFPDQCSRLKSNYYYDTLEKCGKLYRDGWANASEEKRQKIRLFEVEVDGRIGKYDMVLFDKAYDLLADLQSPDGITEIFDLARAYFQGTYTSNPIIEILSDGKARAINDMGLVEKFGPNLSSDVS